MKINELKDKYDEWRKNHDSWEDFPFSNHVKITEYVPVASKIDIAQKAVSEIYEEEGGIRSIDDTTSEIVLLLTKVSVYTDLEYEADESLEAYDMLTQMEFSDHLKDALGEEDYRFNSVYYNTITALIADHNDLSAVVDRAFKRFEDRIAGAIENMSAAGNLNMEEIEKMQAALNSINDTMKKVQDVKAADVIEAYKK